MTAAELIAELRKFPPGMAVRVCTRTATTCDESGDFTFDLNEADAQEADEVRHGGAYVMVWGGRP